MTSLIARMFHKNLVSLHAPLHSIFLVPLLVFMCDLTLIIKFLSTCDHTSWVTRSRQSEHFHLCSTLFGNEFTNNHALSRIRHLCRLFIDVRVLSMSNNFSTRKLDFTSGQNSRHFYIKLSESFKTSLTFPSCLNLFTIKRAQRWCVIQISNTTSSISNNFQGICQKVSLLSD